MRSKSRPLLVMLIVTAVLAIMLAGQGQSSAQDNDFTAIAASQNQFAFDFYQQIRDDNQDNLIFSPYSIWQALAMVYAGARGNTETQMATALHFDLPQAELHPMIAGLNADIANRAELPPNTPAEYANNQPLQLNIANGLWGQDGAPFEQAYLDILAQQYQSEMHSADFATGDRVAITDEINAWVAQETQDKITDLVPAGVLTKDTKLVLVNAIYFKGSWVRQFSEDATTDSPFFLLDDSQVSVPMMYRSGESVYALTDQYTAVELPYFGGTAAMLLIMPTEGQFETFEVSFDQTAFDDLLAHMGGGEALLYVPKFEIATKLELNDVLVTMGMTDAFDQCAADFKGIATFPGRTGCEKNLFIADALHKAYVRLDEKGTEAAAATSVRMAIPEGVGTPPPHIRFDHPFIYAIYDKPTGTILFMGRVMNPAE